MTRTRQATGKAIARRYLETKGYQIREANYRGRYGEIDLIATHNDVLTFVEVRARRAGGFGLPEESITAGKRKRLAAAAHEYLQQHDLMNADWRIDVVAIEMGGRGRTPRIEIIQNAIEG